jgi:hypothetical protein
VGIEHDATQDEITAAYREQVKRHHPDVSDRDDATERFQAVKRAEEVLADESKRATYDRLGHRTYVRYYDDGAAKGAAGTGHTSTRSWTREPTETDARTTGTGTRTDTATGPTGDPYEDFGRASSSVGFGTGASRQSGAGTVNGGEDRWSAGAYAAGDANDPDDGPTYSVHDWDDAEVSGPTVTVSFTQEFAVIAVSMVLLYPMFLYTAVSGMFPLVVNVVMAGLTLLLVGYSLTVPKLAVAVFGTWSLFAPVAVLALGVGPVLSVFALAASWIPFGYALVVAYVTRPG